MQLFASLSVLAAAAAVVWQNQSGFVGLGDAIGSGGAAANRAEPSD